MTLADRIVSWFDPVAGLKRRHARKVLSYFEAAKPDRNRKARRETGSGNDAVLRAGASLREQARHLEQNYDLAVGVLNTLAANCVGPAGIGIEPQPRRADGSIDDDFARDILKLHKDWSRHPEVTWRHDRASMERLLFKSWMRDGEVFAQQLTGSVPYLDHGTQVPYSVEMIEADYVPLDLNASQPTIVQGCEINAWGRPVAWHVYKGHPAESFGMVTRTQTKRIAAADMLQAATVSRVRQLRGVSIFASVMGRFENLKDYEESERIAAMIAASMAAYIKKGSPDQYDPDASGDSRQMKFRPGMIFDDLQAGEEIGTIDTNRPNPNLEAYRNGQIKMLAAGTGPSFSSVAKTYDGTYSAKRQELVESWSAYGTLSNEFIGDMIRPMYERFIAAAILSGKLKVPAGIVRDSVDDALYIPPQMPWIDPKKEAEFFKIMEDKAYMSGPEIIRRRGGNPLDVLEQQSRWLREKEKRLPASSAERQSARVDDADAMLK